MLTIRAMSNGQGYSARHLEHSDYYAEGERVMGQWQGRGAELLGLSGEVKSEQFEAVRQGLDPQTGEFLRQRQSADRVAADGTTMATGFSRQRHPHDHAEEGALATLAPGDPRLARATLYSSLEPCRFRASRPCPCAELIIAAGLRRVVIAWLEPPVFVPGGGAELLRSSGVIVVEIPELAGQARAVNASVLGG